MRSSVAYIFSVSTPFRIVSVAMLISSPPWVVCAVVEASSRAARAASAPPPKSTRRCGGMHVAARGTIGPLEARDPLLHLARRGGTRICERRRRPAAGEGGQLDEPSRIRPAESGVAALGPGAGPGTHAGSLRRARLRALR